MSLAEDIETAITSSPANTSEAAANLASAILANVNIPIGIPLPWFNHITGVPALPSNWVQCNGQTISDPASPLDGQTIPDINGNGWFIRGSSTAGTVQQDQFQGHYHESGAGGAPIGAGSDGRYTTSTDPGWSDNPSAAVRNPKTDGTNGTPRTGSETRPVNISAVWVMRIKD